LKIESVEILQPMEIDEERSRGGEKERRRRGEEGQRG
jgi:hypothetical protein